MRAPGPAPGPEDQPPGPRLPLSLGVSVGKGGRAAVLWGPGAGAHEGRVRSVLLEADPGRPGWLSVKAADVPQNGDPIALWNLDRPPQRLDLDPLDPLAAAPPSLGSAAPDRCLRRQGDLNFHQTQTYEVWAATGRIHRVAGDELSLEEVPHHVGDELLRQGWQYGRWLEESGHDLQAGAAVFHACPSDADLSSVRWYGAPGRLGEVRRQAAAAMPLFAGIIARNPTLRACVDRQQPLSERLRKALPSLGAGGIRRLGRVSSGTAEQGVLGEAFTRAGGEDVLGNTRQRRLPLAGGWRTEEAIMWLDGLAGKSGGVDMVPSSDGEWASFSSIWSGMLLPVSTHLGNDSQRISPPGGSWCALHEGLAKDLDWQNPDPPARQALNVAVVDAIELADLLATDVILPVIHQAIIRAAQPADGCRVEGNEQVRTCLRQAAYEMLVPVRVKQPYRALAGLVRQGLTRMSRLEAVRHDGEHGGRMAATNPLTEDWVRERWAVPFRGELTMPNGAVIRFIPDRDGLRAEGKAMHHCIGRDGMGYWRACWSAKGAAAHVSPGPGWDELDPTGQGRMGSISNRAAGATAYFEVDSNGWLSLSQLYGYQNARVNRSGSPFRDAVQDFVRMQDEGELVPNPAWPEFRAWAKSDAAIELTGRRVFRNPWEQICGYDPLEAGRTEALWLEWRELVPGAGRIDEPARAVWRSESARSALEMISPATFRAMAEQAPAPARPTAVECGRQPAGPEGP